MYKKIKYLVSVCEGDGTDGLVKFEIHARNEEAALKEAREEASFQFGGEPDDYEAEIFSCEY